MPKEWYVSFHGGEEEASLNNIHVYSTDGMKLRKALNKKSLPEATKLRELRGFVFGPDQNLYVVNAYFEYSEVLKFRGALNEKGQHDFAEVFVKRHTEMNPGIDHPFNVAFDSEGDLYVSSQNTNLIARYHGPASKTGKPGTPMPLPQGLDLENVDLPPGTFIPSAKFASNGLLDVRAVIFAPNNDLYVADRAADFGLLALLSIACEFMRLVRVDICGTSCREPISSIGRSICCLVQMVVTFLLGVAGTIQFCGMIFSRAPRASLSNQSPGVSMVPLEWHSVMTAFSMLPVAIQRKFFVTVRSTGDHAVSLSSRTFRIIRSF